MPSEYPLVPTYRELEFRGSGLTLDTIADEVVKSIVDPWERATDVEGGNFLEDKYRVFRRKPTHDLPGLTLHITVLRDRIYVPNVVPTEVGELTVDQYNAAVSEFYERFAQPAAQALAGEAVLGEPVIDLEKEVAPEAFRALTTFSRTSNRSTGAGHPSDQRKWFEFLALAHGSPTELTSDVLREWLVLDGWSESKAWDLSQDYEFAMGLLKYVDSR